MRKTTSSRHITDPISRPPPPEVGRRAVGASNSPARADMMADVAPSRPA
ncbi:MAG: hypothetical protein AAF845_08875 [Bacteroidota bacterium]